MSDVQVETRSRKPVGKRLLKLFMPVIGVAGAFLALSVVYFGYDVAKAKVSPCESIFQQTTAGLSTKIEFLKAKGELTLGPSKVAELDERAQMTALDLKTCCTVLDAGRINPEQFLTCKSKARSYDERVDKLVDILRTVVAERTNTAAGVPVVIPAALETAVDDVRTASQDLNQHIVKVVADEGLRSLNAAPVQHLKIDAVEKESNDDILNANTIEPGKEVKSAIAPVKDADLFTFTTPATFRDWIRIELTNRSTTLEPGFDLFDGTKAKIGSASNTTAGGDLSYEFVAPPASTFSVRVASYYGEGTGVYLLRVIPRKAYDAFEPNEDILSAHRITEGTAIKAGIMDKGDADFYSIEGGTAERSMKVVIANGSATLHPTVRIYDASKTDIAHSENTTPGGDLTLSFKAPKGPVHVRVSDYYGNDAGAYTLTVSPE